MRPSVLDPTLYERAKAIVYPRYRKPSAYRSGALQKTYQELGGRYSGVKEHGPLRRWFLERWQDVNPMKRPGSYPVYRPTIRIDETTPLTRDEVDPDDLVKQAKLKQRYKGSKNLPAFEPRKSIAIV